MWIIVDFCFVIFTEESFWNRDELKSDKYNNYNMVNHELITNNIDQNIVNYNLHYICGLIAENCVR